MSVVVPAHNEQRSLRRCLRALVEPGANDLEVLVVCNGCSDATADVARSFGPAVTVLEIGEASKPLALDAGDRRAGHFPRFYVDADVEVTSATLRRLAGLMERGGYLAAATTPELSTAHCSWIVRSYYRLWSRLPQVGDSLVGGGVYGTTGPGRSRFGRFPAGVADDAYVSAQFRPEERLRAAGCTSVVRPAATLGELYRSRRRVHLWNRSAGRAAGPGGGIGHRRGLLPGWLVVVGREPARLLDLPSYLAVTGAAKVAARRASSTGTSWSSPAR